MKELAPLYGVVVVLGAIIVRAGIRAAVRKTLGKRSPARAVAWFLGAASGIAFVTLTTLATRMPAHRSDPFRMKDEIIRFTALGAGVIFLVAVLAALLPIVLDLLEGRSFPYYVGARHVRATKSGFLTVISVLSISGVGRELVRALLGHVDHGRVRPRPEAQDPRQQRAHRHRLDASGRVHGLGAHTVRGADRPRTPWGGAATPVVGGEAMGSSASNTAGALVRGIDPETIGEVIDLKSNIEVGKFGYLEHPESLTNLPPDEVIGRGPTGEPYFKGPEFRWSDADPSVRDFLKQTTKTLPGVIIGRELAKSLHVYVGDEITLLSPMGELGPTGVMPRSRKFRVAAIFYSGMYEYDATHAYVLMGEAQRFFSLEGKITHIDIRLPDPERVKEFRPAVEAAVAEATPIGTKGAHARVRDWMEMNKNLFSALKLEKLATFVILSIAIMVASFCIVCTLLLMVTEKSKEIAILKALGATDRAIMGTFMVEGIIIGGIGTIFGVGTALAACTGLSWFGVRLDPEVYYIDRLPVNVDARDYTLVAVAAFLICTIATIYPARAASKLSPVEGLRWE